MERRSFLSALPLATVGLAATRSAEPAFLPLPPGRVYGVEVVASVGDRITEIPWPDWMPLLEKRVEAWLDRRMRWESEHGIRAALETRTYNSVFEFTTSGLVTFGREGLRMERYGGEVGSLISWMTDRRVDVLYSQRTRDDAESLEVLRSHCQSTGRTVILRGYIDRVIELRRGRRMMESGSVDAIELRYDLTGGFLDEPTGVVRTSGPHHI
jgi:hypothetical protein